MDDPAPSPKVVTHLVGRQREPVVVIDGFHPDPAGLRAAAATTAFGPARHYYPGIRGELPDSYGALTHASVASVLREAFGHPAGAKLIDASFSIVTTPPHALTMPQRLPHVDATDRRRIAMVHYLDPAGGDGTSFYRHRATAFETIDEGRESTYFPALHQQLRGGDAPAVGYIDGDTPLFERTATIAARYNRAVIYRSTMLHSGAIAVDATLSDDPLTGRLTVTAFFEGR